MPEIAWKHTKATKKKQAQKNQKMSSRSVRKYKQVNKIQHNCIDLTQMREPPNSTHDPEQPERSAAS